MMKKDGKIRADDGFKSYLYSMARSICVDYHRAEKRKLSAFLSITHQQQYETVENLFIKKEEMESYTKLRALIQRLPDDQKEIVILRMYSKIPFKVIAQVYGESINTTIGRLRYAKNSLRSMLLKQARIDNRVA